MPCSFYDASFDMDLGGRYKSALALTYWIFGYPLYNIQAQRHGSHSILDPLSANSKVPERHTPCLWETRLAGRTMILSRSLLTRIAWKRFRESSCSWDRLDSSVSWQVCCTTVNIKYEALDEKDKLQIGKLTEKYLKRGTGTSESYKDISTVPFPVLTICPTYPYRDERIAYHGVDIVRDIQVRNLMCHIKKFFLIIDFLL